MDVLLSCNPPFAAEPDCFTSVGHFMISSPACAIAYARLFNITDATPLASVAANVNAIQDACTQVTTEVLSRRFQGITCMGIICHAAGTPCWKPLPCLTSDWAAYVMKNWRDSADVVM